MSTEVPLFGVSDFIAYLNQTLEYAYPSVNIEGEVASFKVNQNKYVFFDLKDAEGTVPCFMMVWQLRTPIEDGMKVVITAVPKLTNWGKFSLTVRAIRPSGEGALKQSFALLQQKLNAEGLFAIERKRTLPSMPKRVGVISSTQAAGYGDFIKILDDRWGGLEIVVAHVQVQGEGAPDQMIQALRYLNQQTELLDVIVLIRGGGSADDLSAFNDELLVREIAGSRTPTLVGVGHEVDQTLADLAADVRASTPSNAAQILVPDRQAISQSVRASIQSLLPRVLYVIDQTSQDVRSQLATALGHMVRGHERLSREVHALGQSIHAYDPGAILRRGYAVLSGQVAIGSTIEIETSSSILSAEVRDVRQK